MKDAMNVPIRHSYVLPPGEQTLKNFLFLAKFNQMKPKLTRHYDNRSNSQDPLIFKS